MSQVEYKMKIYFKLFLTYILFYIFLLLFFFFPKGEILNGLNCKRKQQFEDVNQFKKSKINEDKSGISHSQFTCSVTSKNLKRFREDDTIVAANYKRIR